MTLLLAGACGRMPPRGRHPASVDRGLRVRRDGGPLLVLGERLEHELTDPVLRGDVGDGPQQREAATLTIDGVLPRRERDVPATTAAALPDAEADPLQAFEFAVGEMQLGIGEFGGRVALSFGVILTMRLMTEPPEKLAGPASGGRERGGAAG